MSRDEPRSLPADVEIAERTLLGTIAQSPEIIPVATRECPPRFLYDDRRRHLYEAALALHERMEPIAAGPIISELRARDRWSPDASAELGACLEHFCEPVNLPYYCRTIRSEWATRARIKLANELGDAYASDGGAAAETLERLAAINDAERGPGAPRWASRVYCGSDFDALTMPAMPSLLGDRMLCAGELAVLFGPTGKGKSFLGEQLIHAVATGTDWLGIPTIRDGAPVLAVHLELSGERLQHRRRSRWGSTPANLHTTTSDLLGFQIDVLKDADRDALVEIALNIGAKLIYVDPLQEFHSAGETNEAFHKVVRACSEIMIRSGAAILVAHHEPKGLTEKGAERTDMDSLRGGTRLGGAVKLAMRLKELKNPRHFDLVFPKATHVESPKPLYLKQNTEGWFDLAGERPAERADRTVDAIERILLLAGEPVRLAKIREALESQKLPSSHRTVQEALDRLATNLGFRSRSDLQIGSGRDTAYRYLKPEMGADMQGVQYEAFAPHDSEVF